jgi:hypothetical protein
MMYRESPGASTDLLLIGGGDPDSPSAADNAIAGSEQSVPSQLSNLMPFQFPSIASTFRPSSGGSASSGAVANGSNKDDSSARGDGSLLQPISVGGAIKTMATDESTSQIQADETAARAETETASLSRAGGSENHIGTSSALAPVAALDITSAAVGTCSAVKRNCHHHYYYTALRCGDGNISARRAMALCLSGTSSGVGDGSNCNSSSAVVGTFTTVNNSNGNNDASNDLFDVETVLFQVNTTGAAMVKQPLVAAPGRYEYLSSSSSSFGSTMTPGFPARVGTFPAPTADISSDSHSNAAAYCTIS